MPIWEEEKTKLTKKSLTTKNKKIKKTTNKQIYTLVVDVWRMCKEVKSRRTPRRGSERRWRSGTRCCPGPTWALACRCRSSRRRRACRRRRSAAAWRCSPHRRTRGPHTAPDSACPRCSWPPPGRRAAPCSARASTRAACRAARAHSVVCTCLRGRVSCRDAWDRTSNASPWVCPPGRRTIPSSSCRRSPTSRPLKKARFLTLKYWVG